MSQAYRSRGIASWTRLVPPLAVTLIFAGVLVSADAANAQTPISPEGIWYTKDQESIIRVHPCVDQADDFCGTLVWLKAPTETDGTPKVDKNNHDPAKQTKPIVGTDILLQMKSDGDHWKGSAYNPEDGKIYDITFKVKSDKNDIADLRGCVFGFLCRTETFTRASSVPGGDPTLTADATKKHKPKKDVKSTAHK